MNRNWQTMRSGWGVLVLLVLIGCSGTKERPAPPDPAPPPQNGQTQIPVVEPPPPAHPPGTPGVVIGRVLGPDGPVQGLLVQMQGEELFQAQSDALGEYTVNDVKPGEYLLSVVDLAAVQSGDFHIKTRATSVGPGELVEEDFEFGMGVDFTGTVAGAPVATRQVQIMVVRPGAPSLTGTPLADKQASIELTKYVEGSDFLDPDRSFRVVDLSPGTYEVRIRVWPDSNTPPHNPWPAPTLIDSIEVDGLPVEKNYTVDAE